MSAPEPEATESGPTSLLESMALCGVCRTPLNFSNSWITRQAAYFCPDLHIDASAHRADIFITELCIKRLEQPDVDALRITSTGVTDIRSWWESASIASRREVVDTLLVALINPDGNIEIEPHEE